MHFTQYGEHGTGSNFISISHIHKMTDILHTRLIILISSHSDSPMLIILRVFKYPSSKENKVEAEISYVKYSGNFF